MKAVAGALAALLLSTTAALADDPIRPNPQLTPGAVLTIDAAAICRPGYSKSVRHVSPETRRSVYAEYGIKRHPRSLSKPYPAERMRAAERTLLDITGVLTAVPSSTQ